MKKWVGSLISLILIVAFLIAFGPFSNTLKSTKLEREGREGPRIFLAQKADRDEGREESDPHFIQILKHLREKIDEWVKSLDERIESEDITRFEVRFLEIFRNSLEWVKEKIDAKIASSKEKRNEKKGRQLYRETRQQMVRLLDLC